MTTFMELRFHRVGELAHAEAVTTVKAVPGVELLFDHTRALGWLERQQLWVDEWDCRIVLWIHEHAEREQVLERTSTELDPYRFLDFGGPVRRVPAQLAKLIGDLDADYALVDSGWLRFETRAYELALTERLRDELLAIAGTYAAARFASERGVLAGRIEGRIPAIRALQRALLRSGLVDPDRVRVGYA
jgi:hypothetical protein